MNEKITTKVAESPPILPDFQVERQIRDTYQFFLDKILLPQEDRVAYVIAVEGPVIDGSQYTKVYSFRIHESAPAEFAQHLVDATMTFARHEAARFSNNPAGESPNPHSPRNVGTPSDA